MNDLFKLLMSEKLDPETFYKYLDGYSIKVSHNGEPVIDIENGVDKLKPAYPKRVNDTITRTEENTYQIAKSNADAGKYLRVHFTSGEGDPGINPKDLLILLRDYYAGNTEIIRGIEYAEQRL